VLAPVLGEGCCDEACAGCGGMCWGAVPGRVWRWWWVGGATGEQSRVGAEFSACTRDDDCCWGDDQYCAECDGHGDCGSPEIVEGSLCCFSVEGSVFVVDR